MIGTKILTTDTADRLPYTDFELDRCISTINGQFMNLDGEGPIGQAITTARDQGRIAVLDAGCGTGKALIRLKDQIAFRADVPEQSIEALGVSLADYSYAFGGAYQERLRLSDGHITIALGNLATIALQPEHYDVAYSYEVLIHNQSLYPILSNVVASVRSRGSYYFNTHQDQMDEVQDFANDHDVSLKSLVLSGREPGRSATRAFFKLTKS